jgi:hypothetical protein
LRSAATGFRRSRLLALAVAVLGALLLAAPAHAGGGLLDRLGGAVARVVEDTIAGVAVAPAPPVPPAPEAGTPSGPSLPSGGAPSSPPPRAVAGDPGCPGRTSRPFLRWLDPAPYVLAPGGDFEAPSGWSLSGGARVAEGNEPFHVGGRDDRRSLVLPAGGSATSPPVCVGLLHPTLRFFAAGPARSRLQVEVVYRTLLGPASHTVAVLPARSRWAPTLPLPFLANAVGLTALEGATTTVQLRFTATGGGWRIDDVYVDPWKID